MSSEQLVLQRLEQIEAIMRDHQLWQDISPETRAFESEEPFCLDRMAPLEWLQWVLIPRMQALIAARASLPKNFAITPYYEVALTPTTPGRAPLLVALTQLDALFSEDDR